MAALRNRWFGDPWPSAEEPAPVCDDEAFRVDAPLGEPCLYCPDAIVEGERGVVMASEPTAPHFAFEVAPGVWIPAVAVHIDCLMRATVGPEVEEMVSRAAGVTRRP